MTPNALLLTRPVVLAIFGLANCSGVAGQTEDQLEKRYRHTVGFEVRPGIEAYPTFAAKGEVCRMVIAKRPRVDNKEADLDTTLQPALIKEIEDELVSPEARGHELSPHLNNPASWLVGESSYIQKDYENLSVGVYSGSAGPHAIVITWRNRTCIQ